MVVFLIVSYCIVSYHIDTLYYYLDTMLCCMTCHLSQMGGQEGGMPPRTRLGQYQEKKTTVGKKARCMDMYKLGHLLKVRQLVWQCQLELGDAIPSYHITDDHPI